MVGGDDALCGCCESTCGVRKARDVAAGTYKLILHINSVVPSGINCNVFVSEEQWHAEVILGLDIQE